MKTETDRDLVFLTTIQPGEEWVVRNDIEVPVHVFTQADPAAQEDPVSWKVER